VARVLIIDDDLGLDPLVESLHFRGHDVHRIPTAAEALRNIEEIVSADLVVLDIIMALPDGYQSAGVSGYRSAGMEILREIRKRKRNLPVIACRRKYFPAVNLSPPLLIFTSRNSLSFMSRPLHDFNQDSGNEKQH